MDSKKKATVFEFTSYQFEPEKKRIVFYYKTHFNHEDPITFTEAILLPQAPRLQNISPKLTERILQSLHIILGISYYKFYCAPKIQLPYELSKDEANFWNTVYQKGLGEFFYQNKLDPKNSPKFPFKKRTTKITPFTLPKNQKCLVGIGGGKDSIVALELLKEQGFDVTAFHVQTNQTSDLIEKVIQVSGAPELTLKRHLDWQVHQPHQYNGHVPVSAVYAFLGLLSAVLYGYEYIVVGNEHSSNFGNTKYKGLDINHQWSKSLEFEKLFQNYVGQFITSDVTYFSLLRSFYEIRIVKLFSNYKKYFSIFSSCNVNFSTKSGSASGGKLIDGSLWCGKCPKCVFAFILLSAFLERKILLQIFQKNLYTSENLLPLFKDVLGLGTMKPFDCVGTFSEAQTAMHMAHDNYQDDFIMRQLGGKISEDPEVFKTQKDTCIPTLFAFLGMEKIAVVGYGKEGMVSEKYLKTYYPRATISILDQKQGSDYLSHQADFDMAIKSPGIQKELITIPYTTATNLFFSRVSGKHMIIGVTGSKGKSTTASLIFEILKTAQKNVVLLGNIGKPMLEYLLKPIEPDTIFVLELSSYQLDDITFSPDIAVVTNLFPEHMDFHGSLKKYYQAKENIIRQQKEHQYFVYHKKTKPWLKKYRGIAVPFAQDFFESNLLGAHNQSNIGAAVAVARILKISDADIQKALSGFKGLNHRLQNIGTFGGITFYDDAISTTPESTIEAIKALKKVDTIFLGGQDRGYRFTELEKLIKTRRVKNIVLFPDSGRHIIKNKKPFTILETKSMEEAVAFAYKNTPRGGICLLSCASPSYSLWKNFEEKGEEFKAMVLKLAPHEI